jgi:hypothetical protein
MSREARLARTIRRAVERRFEKERERFKPKSKRIMVAVKVLLFFLGVPSLLIGVLQTLPRLSVIAQDPLDARNPFLAPFVISNDGYVTLYDVHAICSPRYVQMIGIDGKGGQIVLQTPGKDEDETGGFSNPNFVAEKLPPANKMTFPCQIYLGPDFPDKLALARTDIAYVVTYHAFGITRHHVNRFSLAQDTKGTYHWLEEPLGVR